MCIFNGLLLFLLACCQPNPPCVYGVSLCGRGQRRWERTVSPGEGVWLCLSGVRGLAALCPPVVDESIDIKSQQLNKYIIY